ncbi:MAG: exonuclease SbcCD subunit D [Anaerolineales bacterium]|nr:exonuclease SbcCD subunit D [Anaerolineales bacterium]
MVKVLHFADVHIGMENHGRTNPQTGLSSRVTDFLRRMDDMIDDARHREPDLVIFAGDAFKNRTPNPTFQREFAWRILDLAELCPVVLLVGNHDLPINTKKASTIEIYETLRVPNVWVGRNNELHWIETKSGPIQVATIPYPIRARLLEDDIPQRTITDLDSLLQERLELIIRDLAKEAAQHDTPRILTGHFSVMGAIRGSERQVMLGRDIAITLGNLADPTWDYIALGHIHKHQNLTEGQPELPPVVYSGSLERIDFGEEGDPKGYIWAEVERGHTEWEFVPVQARPFITLRFDVCHEPNPTVLVLEGLQSYDVHDAIVRVIVKTDPENNSLLSTHAIDKALREAGVSYVASIQRDVQQPARMRLGPTPEGLSPGELLERYLESREVPGDRIKALVEAAQKIFEGQQS